MFEKAVNSQIIAHLEGQDLLNSAQHGFCKHCSSESALLRLTNLLLTTRQRKQWSCLVAIYFTKAFDLFDHKSLLAIAATKYNFVDLEVN